MSFILIDFTKLIIESDWIDSDQMKDFLNYNYKLTQQRNMLRHDALKV